MISQYCLISTHLCFLNSTAPSFDSMLLKRVHSSWFTDPLTNLLSYLLSDDFLAWMLFIQYTLAVGKAYVSASPFSHCKSVQLFTQPSTRILFTWSQVSLNSMIRQAYVSWPTCQLCLCDRSLSIRNYGREEETGEMLRKHKWKSLWQSEGGERQK